MRFLAVAGLAVGLLGCTTAPSISSVTPSNGDCAAAGGLRLRVAGSALGPAVQVDLSSGETHLLAVVVGSAVLTDVVVVGRGDVLEGILPGGVLVPGVTYDVKVVTASGAQTTLPGAFRCDPPVGPDGGDAGDAGEDGDAPDGSDLPEDAGDAPDGSGPVGPTVILTNTAVAGAAGSTASVAWVRDRWVVAYVEEVASARVLRLAEIAPGAAEASATTDVAGPTVPTDPVVRAWPGRAGLAWMSRNVGGYFYMPLDETLAPSAAPVYLASAEDPEWRRDYDVAPGAAGLVAFVAVVTEWASAPTMQIAVLDEDGTVGVPPTPLGATPGTPAEPRAAWVDGAFRVVWWEDAEGVSGCRAAATDASGVVVAGPIDLPPGGTAAAPSIAGFAAGGSERLLLCYESIASVDSHGISRLIADPGFAPVSGPEVVVAVGRGARCAAGPGMVAWTSLTSWPTVSVDLVDPDGSMTERLAVDASDVRTTPGIDLAVGPTSTGIVWIEETRAGGPSSVRFVEIRPGG